jgi:tRNA dimethylallyltransferase
LLEEVRSLAAYKDLNALNTVGYKELFDHLEGNSTLAEAIDKIKQNTRNFAKRQLTWWRKDGDIHWIDPTNRERALASILKVMANTKG